MLFLDFLRQQQPDARYLRLFHKVVLDVWNDKQADATALVRKFEKQVDELRERKKKLNDAFVFQQAITADDYKEMKDALNTELAVVELNLSHARVDEVEVDEVLDFAENLLLNPAGAWQHASLEQKQRLQQILFPQGIEYTDGVYRTQETSFLFRELQGIAGQEEVFGSATAWFRNCGYACPK